MKTQKLIAAEQAVEDINGMNYTPASAAVLQAAYDMPEGTEAEADAKADAIQAAISGLVPVDDDQPKKTDKKKGFNKNWLWLLLLLIPLGYFIFAKGDSRTLTLKATPSTGIAPLNSHVTLTGNFDKAVLDLAGSKIYSYSPKKDEAGTIIERSLDPSFPDTGDYVLTLKGYWGKDSIVTSVTVHVTGSTPPATGANPPATGTNPPATGANPPATGANPPATGANPPATGANPPATGANPPATGANPPATGVNPPATGTNPPATNTNPPVVSNPSNGTTPVVKAKQKLPYHYVVITKPGDTTAIRFKTADSTVMVFDQKPVIIKNFTGQTGPQTKFQSGNSKFDVLKGYKLVQRPDGKWEMHAVGGDEPAVMVGRKYKVKY